jgi:pyruvate/2-oxoacid:ferredoxin oxidoreductase alpha subunit
VQAYRIAERLHLPVMVCYDGFLLSHTMMPVSVPDAAEVDAFLPPFTDPWTVVDPADPRNVGPVTLADPRADASGIKQPGYMEVRAFHHRALLDALEVIPEVDAAYGAAVGRSWGGLLWEHMLDDAEIVLVAAGSLAMQLTLTAEALRAEGIRAGVLGIRAYRPFPVEALRERLAGRTLALVFDKALSYGYEGPICSDLRGSLLGFDGAPAVFGTVCGLGGRDVTPEHLVDAAHRAVADVRAGARTRETEWIGLAK